MLIQIAGFLLAYVCFLNHINQIQYLFILEHVHFSKTMSLWDATSRGCECQSTVPQRLIPLILIQCIIPLEPKYFKIMSDALIPGLLRLSLPKYTRICY